MIAHRIARKSGRDRFERLACYVTDLADKRDTRAFERLATYVADVKRDGERVLGTRISNCSCEDLRLAIDEIEHTQARNTRAKGDKSYHLVVSFPEGERPTLDQLHHIEDRLCEAIGLGSHQRISAIHDDTDNLHIHIAINKVHAESHRLVEPFCDHPKLMAACVELEIFHGLRRDNHGPRAERAPEGRAAKMEAYSGRESFQRWVVESCGEELRAALQEATTWSALQHAFATRGSELRLRGAGLVIADRRTGVTMKASSLGREFGYGALTKRFGAFEPAPPLRRAVEPGRRYAERPQDRKADGLWRRYSQEREAAREQRKSAREALRVAHRTYSGELKKHHAWRLGSLLSDVHLRAEERRALRKSLAAERRRDWEARRAGEGEQRRRINAENVLPTWDGFLQREAQRGDATALKVLRSRSRAERRLTRDILTANDAQSARHVVERRSRFEVQGNGDVVYKVDGGGRVTDTASVVHLNEHSTAAAFLALSLAVARFGNQPLVLEGSNAFKSAILQVAALPEFTVQFADRELNEALFVAVSARDRPCAPEISELDAYIEQRNEPFVSRGLSPRYRLCTGADVGNFTYGGLSRLSDGAYVQLLQRGAETLVRSPTDEEVGQAQGWSLGHEVRLDEVGRIVARSSPTKQRADHTPARRPAGLER